MVCNEKGFSNCPPKGRCSKEYSYLEREDGEYCGREYLVRIRFNFEWRWYNGIAVLLSMKSRFRKLMTRCYRQPSLDRSRLAESLLAGAIVIFRLSCYVGNSVDSYSGSVPTSLSKVVYSLGQIQSWKGSNPTTITRSCNFSSRTLFKYNIMQCFYPHETTLRKFTYLMIKLSSDWAH